MKCTLLWLAPVLMIAGIGTAADTSWPVVIAVSEESRLIVVAHGATATVSAYRFNDMASPLWTVEGTSNPSFGVSSSNGRLFAILDSMNNALVTVTSSGKRRIALMPESPISAAYQGEALFVLCRDARKIVRIEGENRIEAPTAIDPVFLATGTHAPIVVYSRTSGALEEFVRDDLSPLRKGEVAPFASDLEEGAAELYLTYPRIGEVHVVSRDSLAVIDRVKVGSVPTDTYVHAGSALRSAMFMTADPSSKRIWQSERAQSWSTSFARGFVRGFLGLGLFKPSSRDFPTGVDRVQLGAAYSGGGGILYRTGKNKTTRIASGIASGAWVGSTSGVFYWDSVSHRLRLVR